MKREIKFRAWDNGIMYPMAMVGEPGRPSVLTNSNWRECTEEIVIMQFTGLKDKNGKEIYEGDICTFNQGQPFQEDIKGYIKFSYGSFVFKSPTHNSALHTEKMRFFEIIGNIYENSEIIESRGNLHDAA